MISHNYIISVVLYVKLVSFASVWYRDNYAGELNHINLLVHLA